MLLGIARQGLVSLIEFDPYEKQAMLSQMLLVLYTTQKSVATCNLFIDTVIRSWQFLICDFYRYYHCFYCAL